MRRQQVYFNDLFGWLHSPDVELLRNCAVVICSPLGYEYTHSHRTLRHLADSLAAQGFPTLRFDYHGTGDSPGHDLDPDRLQNWKQNIQAAIAFTHATTGCEKICLMGVRIGATLAALVAAETEVDFLLLWNPVVSGRRYVREMEAIAAASAFQNSKDRSFLEVAGFSIAKETADQIKKISLLDLSLQVKNSVLIIQRDGQETDSSLLDKLRNDKVAADQLSLPGYAEMMAEPQFTKVPERALSTIVDWLLKLMPTAATAASIAKTFPREMRIGALTERSCQFGHKKKFFGILSYGNQETTKKPVIVFLNAGAVHHVGPNRLYVMLARALASQGYTSFRIDLQGLGDSAEIFGEKENHPYPDSAIADTESALDFLKSELGIQQFILLGLCSGAHTAFHASIQLSQRDIVDTVLINPLTFNWVEGMSLETTMHFQDLAYYKNTVWSSKDWLKLLRGKVDLRNPIKFVLSVIIKKIKNLLTATGSSKLSKDLLLLFKQKRPLTLFIATQDPGYDILLDGARAVAKEAIRTKKIRLHWIQNADHTFTTLQSRNDLLSKLDTHFKNTL